jgi:DNA-3-methyladenine glycosylase II
MSFTQVVPLAAQSPFSLSQAISFMRRFPPCQGDFVLGEASIRGAVVSEGHDVTFEIRDRGRLEIELEGRTRSASALSRATRYARDLVGADDSIAPFYDAAAGDVQPFREIVRRLHGLHHVRFLTLAEVTVHAVLAQRTPIAIASRQKRAIRQAFGRGVGELVAFPSFDQLLALGELDFLRVLRHPKKAAMLPTVLRRVHALGESRLRDEPYAEASAALQAIPGIGPFSAAFILLRGLGRMDEVPLEMPSFTDVAKRVYGASFDPARVRARYGRNLGYWAHYLKAGQA